MGKPTVEYIREEMERSYRPPQGAGRAKGTLAGRPPSPESAALASAIAALYASYALVGQLPPEPPTFRGRMGARIVKLVKRALFWYTPQIVYFQYSALRVMEEQAKMLDLALGRIRHLEGELGKERAQNENMRREAGGGSAPE